MSIGVAVHFLGDIHRIVDRALAQHYAIANHDAIPHYNGINGMNNAIQCYTILHSPQGV
jgi:hypothetical protein